MEIIQQRKLAQTQHQNNLDSLKLPHSMVQLMPNKARLYESMRRHENELKAYLRAKLTNLKEDCLQGHYKCATKRVLAI